MTEGATTCPHCGKPATFTTVRLSQGDVRVVSCPCVPPDAPFLMSDGPRREDGRLSGVRVPRFVDLNSPESSARIANVIDRMRERYPNDGQGMRRARQQAVRIAEIRETGFSEDESAELVAALERYLP